MSARVYTVCGFTAECGRRWRRWKSWVKKVDWSLVVE